MLSHSCSFLLLKFSWIFSINLNDIQEKIWGVGHFSARPTVDGGK